MHLSWRVRLFPIYSHYSVVNGNIGLWWAPVIICFFKCLLSCDHIVYFCFLPYDQWEIIMTFHICQKDAHNKIIISCFVSRIVKRVHAVNITVVKTYFTSWMRQKLSRLLLNNILLSVLVLDAEQIFVICIWNPKRIELSFQIKWYPQWICSNQWCLVWILWRIFAVTSSSCLK